MDGIGDVTKELVKKFKDVIDRTVNSVIIEMIGLKRAPAQVTYEALGYAAKKGIPAYMKFFRKDDILDNISINVYKPLGRPVIVFVPSFQTWMLL